MASKGSKRLGEPTTRSKTVSKPVVGDAASRKRRKMLELFGTMDADPTYDYKAERKRRG